MKKLKTIGIVPIRYESSRLRGKALLKILKKPLFQWVLEAVSQSKEIKHWFVATDSDLISKKVKTLGYRVLRTSSKPNCGTERVWEAIKNKKVDLIFNVQVDEPLILGQHLDALALLFKKNKNLKMGSLAHKTTLEDLSNFNRVKVLLNTFHQAIYFSRFPIPFSKIFQKYKKSEQKKIFTRILKTHALSHESPCLTHVGVYAYTKQTLKHYVSKKPSFIEKKESLEQLRALDLGIPIQILKIPERTLSVDTEKDMKRVEKHLIKKMEKRNKTYSSCGNNSPNGLKSIR